MAQVTKKLLHKWRHHSGRHQKLREYISWFRNEELGTVYEGVVGNKSLIRFETDSAYAFLIGHSDDEPKFSSWGKGVICQVVDVDPITVLANFKNG